MRLYHFLGSRWAIDDIEKQRLKISRLNELNDPFELMCYESPNPAYRAAIRRSKEQVAERIGVLCFSRRWSNPLLWSHYADKHKGICLGFDVDEETRVPVRYRKTRPQFRGDPAELTERFAFEWLSIKYADWSYEDEVRVFLKLDPAEEDGGRYYFKFCPRLQLKEVIIGPLCNLNDALSARTKTHGSALQILKARLAFKSFRIVRDRRGFQSLEATV